MSEDSEDEKIFFKDITNFFPYLKSLEDQILDPEDFCSIEFEKSKNSQAGEIEPTLVFP